MWRCEGAYWKDRNMWASARRDAFVYNSQHQTILKLRRFWCTDLVVGLFLNECMQLRDISSTPLQVPLHFLWKSKYGGKQELNYGVTKVAPWHCFQAQKMKGSKNEMPERPEIIREAPLWEKRQDNRFHSLHFPGEVSAALGRSPGHGVSRKLRTPGGTWKDKPLSQAHPACSLGSLNTHWRDPLCHQPWLCYK